jgi:hypothetical protein
METANHETIESTEVEPRNAVGAPKGSRNAIKHGVYSAKKLLNGKTIDKRSTLFKSLREREQEYISALGGDPSPQEMAIITDAVMNDFYIAHCDNYLLKLKSLMRKGKPHPCLAIRNGLAAQRRADLQAIGLHRRTKPTQSASAILAAEQEVEASASGAQQTDGQTSQNIQDEKQAG